MNASGALSRTWLGMVLIATALAVSVRADWNPDLLT
jgi:hypothetical protein